MCFRGTCDEGVGGRISSDCAEARERGVATSRGLAAGGGVVGQSAAPEPVDDDVVVVDGCRRGSVAEEEEEEEEDEEEVVDNSDGYVSSFAGSVCRWERRADGTEAAATLAM